MREFMSPEAEQAYNDALRRMTPAEKLAAARNLRLLAWELKAAGIRSVHPQLTEAEVEERVRQVFMDAIA